MSEFKVVTTIEQPAAAIRETVKVGEIALTIGQLFGELAEFMQRGKAQMVGPPFVYYHSWSEDGADVMCGFPVAQPIKGEGRIVPFTIPSVKAVAGMHIGPYPKLVETYTAMEQWIRSHGYQPAGYMWESYLNEPGKVPDAELMTEIFWPIE